MSRYVVQVLVQVEVLRDDAAQRDIRKYKKILTNYPQCFTLRYKYSNVTSFRQIMHKYGLNGKI